MIDISISVIENCIRKYRIFIAVGVVASPTLCLEEVESHIR